MATYAITTTTFGPASLAIVTAAMEAHLESVTTTMTLRAYQLIECHRDNQVMGLITHDTPAQPSAIVVPGLLARPTVAHVP